MLPMIDPTLIWNIRGLGNKASLAALLKYVHCYKLRMVAILEPKIPLSKADKIRRTLNFDNVVGNDKEQSNIWLFWNEDNKINVVDYHCQYLTIRITEGNNDPCFITYVYASCNRNTRRDLFESLYRFGNGIASPWLIKGDFNCVLSPNDKVGGTMHFLNSMTDFQGFVASLGLRDAGYKGTKYTWTNKQSGSSFIKARLDRVLLNTEWCNIYQNLEVKHLIRGVSDHSPFL